MGRKRKDDKTPWKVTIGVVIPAALKEALDLHAADDNWSLIAEEAFRKHLEQKLGKEQYKYTGGMS